jgi:endoglucanase
MQSCLAVGAYCVLDVHNFARWNGGIIGQGGPTNEEFADLWTQLATQYADNEFVIFELMNEPHDLIFDDWVVSAQAAVNAIRAAETVSHIILLPGNTFSSAGTFISSGWGAAMANITNPDKSTTNLIFDLHKYLDIDNSGDHEECVMDNVALTFEPVAAWLRTHKRQAIVSETGAAASDSVSISIFLPVQFPEQIINLLCSASSTSALKTHISTTPRMSISATWRGERAVSAPSTS